MRRSKRHFDSQIDRLLAGDQVPDIGAEVAALMTRLQTESADRSPGYGLVPTLAAEASKTESVPARGKSPRTARPLPNRWRRRIMLSTFLSTLLGKLAVGAVALAATSGGLAATGNLPDPAQDWAAERLGSIGIEIPDSNADDTAKDVVDFIENGDPKEGEYFGDGVADTASDGKSSDAGNTADSQGDNADVADDHAVLPDEADNAEPYRP